MEENINMLIKRIDALVLECDKKYNVYNKIIFEIEQLVISVAGRDSEEYKNLVTIYQASCADYDKVPYLRGILGAIRNHILINGIKYSNKSNWDDFLHPIIYKVSYKKLIDGYYSDCVESAIKEVNVRGKNLYKKYKGKELDGSDLFASIFNSDKEKTLLIAGDNLDSQSGKDEQEGYRFLFMGLWKGIRNPKAHANTKLTKNQAVERLIFISMLMYKLDECIKRAGLIE